MNRCKVLNAVVIALVLVVNRVGAGLVADPAGVAISRPYVGGALGPVLW
jgi:hypothetical protein